MRATMGQLKERALRYASMYGAEAVDKNHLRDLVNSGLSELHDLIVNHNGEDYLRKDTTFSIVSTSESYILPDDFYKAIALFYQSNGRRFPLEKWQPKEIGGSETTPLSSGTVEMWYVPQFATLPNDSARIEIAIPVGWEDFVALHAAVRLLIEEESDASAIAQERERQRQRIIALLSPRDNSEPDSIGDVSNRWQQGYTALQIEPSYRYRIMGNYLFVVEVEYRGV